MFDLSWRVFLILAHSGSREAGGFGSYLGGFGKCFDMLGVDSPEELEAPLPVKPA